MGYPQNYNQYDTEEDQQLEIEETLQAHQQFFDLISNINLNPEDKQKIANMEKHVRMMLQTKNNPNMDQAARDQLVNDMKNSIQQILMNHSAPTDHKAVQRPDDNMYQAQENQNLHPNVDHRQRFESSQIDSSMFQESSVNNKRKFEQKMTKKELSTPESVSKRYRESKVDVELGERAKRFDDAPNESHLNMNKEAHMHTPGSIKNHSPIYPLNSQPDMDDEVNEEKQEEMRLTIAERLPHKKWQFRKNAYTEIADMFEHASRGENFYDTTSNGEQYEFNPLERFQEWLIRIIRDSNLIAQYEGLKTLQVYLNCAPDVKNATMSTLPDLLDKVNHKKKNFKDITISIAEAMFGREMSYYIVPELLKRFKTARNEQITIFSIDLLELIISKDRYIDEMNLKHIFKGICNTLVNHNNHIRD